MKSEAEIREVLRIYNKLYTDIFKDPSEVVDFIAKESTISNAINILEWVLDEGE